MTKKERKALQRYLLKFDEINRLNAAIVQLIAASADVKEAEQIFDDLLIDAYIEGFSAVGFLLDSDDNAIDKFKLEAAKDKEYDGESIQDKLRKYYEDGDTDGIKTLIDSEFHRMYGQGGYDNASQIDRPIFKRWMTVGDDKVRDTHDFLDGTTAPLDGYFHSYDGDYGLAPGMFQTADNNANCRCWLTYYYG